MYSLDQRYGGDQQIKTEPRDKTPSHQMNSPLAAFSPSYEHEQVPENLYQHQIQQQQDLMETTSASDIPSITRLLMDRGDYMPQLNSGELSGLSSLLENRGPDLSDSLNRLSTSDLLQ
ncbi:unnamed protein product [Euphydryas editha]|uniref:Uncharacterized protein n=1 Tax=Euphydryas editha TaxID=104508 RepID=A0AAU9V9K7_EUPED|nr:unnamed protein product [Euphydryas editha]